MGKFLLFQRFARCSVFATAVLCAIVARCADGAVDWPEIELREVVARRFAHAMAIANAGDGSNRLFVAERTGRVWIVQNGRVLPEPFLDLSSRADTNQFSGLYSLAFPSDFAAKQHFYACYSIPLYREFPRYRSRFAVARLRVASSDPNHAPARSEEIIIEAEPYMLGGPIAFGRDGYLYIGAGKAYHDLWFAPQDLRELPGKILRIAVESGVAPYAIPLSNPFIARAGARPEIWAFGFQDVSGLSFDSNGSLFITDASYGIAELNFQSASSSGGENYGWPLTIGPHSQPDASPEILPTITRSIAHFASGSYSPGFGIDRRAIGGAMHRAGNSPRLNGTFILGDLSMATISGARLVDGQWRTNDFRDQWDSPTIQPIAIGADETGRVYVADYVGGGLYEVVDSGRLNRPDFSPRRGTTGTGTITITSRNPGAALRYTVDGSEPDESSGMVPSDGRVSVPNGGTVKARAYRDDLLPSAVRAATFAYRAATPRLIPGPYASVLRNELLRMECETPGATIYYITNVWEPNQTVFTYTGPIPVVHSMGYAAWASAPGYEDSERADGNIGIARPETPVIQLSEDYLPRGSILPITCATPGATIYYRVATADGAMSPPQIYSQPLILDSVLRITVYAELEGHDPSEPRFYDLRAAAATPVFDPPPDTINVRQVTISSATDGARIEFRFSSGGVWQNEWTPYTGPALLTGTTTVHARAFSAEGDASREVYADYRWPKVERLDVYPPSGPLAPGSKVEILHPYLRPAPPGLVIRYTLDGSEPNGSSPIYAGPLTLNPPVTLKTAGEFPDSAPGYPENVTTAQYGLIDYERTFVSSYAGYAYGSTDGHRSVARFNSPSALCFDLSGNLFVLDGALVRKISAEGVVTTVLELESARGLTVDAAGNLYTIAESGIIKIAPDLTVSTFASGSFGRIAMGADGRLYYANYQSAGAFSPAGKLEFSVNRWPEGDWRYDSIPVHQNGRFLVGNNSSIFSVTQNDGFQLFAGSHNVAGDGFLPEASFEEIFAMADDGPRGILIGQYNRISRLKDGKVTTLAGRGRNASAFGPLTGPGAVAILNVHAFCADPNGIVYFINRESSRIMRIDPDSAGTGLPDAWQQERFSRVGIDPAADEDGDGASNELEFWTGTNPSDPGSSLAVAVRPADEGLEVRWTTERNLIYQLQCATDLADWVSVGGEVQGDGGTAVYRDLTAGYRNARWFYRVVVRNVR